MGIYQKNSTSQYAIKSENVCDLRSERIFREHTWTRLLYPLYKKPTFNRAPRGEFEKDPRVIPRSGISHRGENDDARTSFLIHINSFTHEFGYKRNPFTGIRIDGGNDFLVKSWVVHQFVSIKCCLCRGFGYVKMFGLTTTGTPGFYLYGFCSTH